MSNVISSVTTSIHGEYNAYRFVSNRRDMCKCRECGTVQRTTFRCEKCEVQLVFIYARSNVYTHKVITEFNDGNKVYSVVGSYVDYSVDRRNFFVKNISLRMKHKANGKIQLTCNGRLVYTSSQVGMVLDYLVGVFGAELPVQSISEYYYTNNPRLNDLLPMVGTSIYNPDRMATFYASISPSVRAKIYYHYDKHGTKGARQAIIGVNHKPLLKLVWNYLELAEPVVLALKKGVGAEQLAHYIGRVSEENQYGVASALASLAVLGVSPAKSFNIVKEQGYSYDNALRDTASMYSQILKKFNSSYALPYPGEYDPRLHNIVQRDFNIYSMGEAGKLDMPVPKSAKEMSEGEYGIVYPKVARELIECGVNMNICVGSYVDRLVSKKLEIFFVKDIAGEYVACLEVRKDRLVQAKLEKNKCVSTNPVIYQFVKDWCEKYNISYDNTYDMNEEQEEGVRNLEYGDDLPF